MSGSNAKLRWDSSASGMEYKNDRACSRGWEIEAGVGRGGGEGGRAGDDGGGRLLLVVKMLMMMQMMMMMMMMMELKVVVLVALMVLVVLGEEEIKGVKGYFWIKWGGSRNGCGGRSKCRKRNEGIFWTCGLAWRTVERGRNPG